MDWSADARIVLIAAATGGLTSIATGAATHWWGHKDRVDAARIAKTHELAQEAVAVFQDVQDGNHAIAEWFQVNFDAIDALPDRVARFRRSAGSQYADEAALVQRLAKRRSDLADALRRARLYLPQALCSDLEAYLATCRFRWSNATPVLDTYYDEFFANLLDSANSAERETLAARVMQGLQEAVS